MSTTLDAKHGVICSLQNDFFGYFGWPSVTRMDDGTLIVAASGLRNEHICPYGRTTICISRDDGVTWSSPRVVNDSPFDDRDAGVLSLGGDSLLLSWFTSDNREQMIERIEDQDYGRATPEWHDGIIWMTDETSPRFSGAWIRKSSDRGCTWDPPIRIPVNTPHGPILLRDGSLIYFGKEFGMNPTDRGQEVGRIMAMRSADAGTTWSELGSVPIYPGTQYANYHEPHVVELENGNLVGHIRVENYDDAHVADRGIVSFSIMQSESTDGGKSWAEMRPLGFHGSPPHLIRHSSGTLICAYGYRKEPYGQRVALSDDDERPRGTPRPLRPPKQLQPRGCPPDPRQWAATPH